MAKISNTGAYPGITNLDALDYLIITDKENDLMTKTATIAQVAALVASIDVGYTSYTALLTQSGVVAPVATVMQDSIAGADGRFTSGSLEVRVYS